MGSISDYVYSIIIPHKNNLCLLKRCLDSIPEERMDVQIIIVDDASDEGKIPKESLFGRKLEIAYIDKEHSKGAGHARNIGLSLALGKWLLFADCDDFYASSFLDVLDTYKDSDYDIVIFDAFWGKNLDTGRCWKSNLHKYIIEFKKNPNNYYNTIMLKHENNSCWNKMYRSEYIKKNNISFEETLSCNDGFFVQYASANTKKICAIDSKLYCYVVNENSITTARQSFKARIEKIKTVGRLHRYMQSVGAGIAIPSIGKGLKTTMKTYGIFRTIRYVLANLYFGVPLYKRIYNCLKKRVVM